MLWSQGSLKETRSRPSRFTVREAVRFAKEQHHAPDDDRNPAFDPDECRCRSARAAQVSDQSDTVAAHNGAWPDGPTSGTGRPSSADTGHASPRRAPGGRHRTPGARSLRAHSKHLERVLKVAGSPSSTVRPRESGDPASFLEDWVPACAGTNGIGRFVR